MSDRLLLRVQCPGCGVSLMDPHHLLDRLPAIRLQGRMDEASGILWLSALYGSHALEADFPLPDEGIVALACPHCGDELAHPFTCDACGAPMAALDVVGGGKVHVCTRLGCHRHFLEISDPAREVSTLCRTTTAAARQVADEGDRVALATGTFLATYCPHCRVSLIRDEDLVFEVQNPAGEWGELVLSPYLNVFNHESTVDIPASREVQDLRCPECHHSLVVPDRTCDACGAHVAAVTVLAMRKLITFYICLREGCHWHGISTEDTQLIALEASAEW